MFIASSDPLGVISQSSFWSTARSGGAHGLGIVSDPAEINRTLTGNGGHAGLGVVPNDFQLAYHRPYLPVMHGWIGSDRAGNLGSAVSEAANGGATSSQMDQLIKSEQFKSKLAILSTGAIVTLALFGVINFLRD